tara:strand:+ start:4383 stop:5036 length:654 start_codon:yes stop_codon:yes gene_type:complete
LKSYNQIKARLEQLKALMLSNDRYNALIEELEWILESTTDCPLCSHPDRLKIELSIRTETATPEFLETKYRWPTGTVMEHMNEHLEYKPEEGQALESMRKDTINTLNSADNLLQRMNTWLDEWEEKKDAEGITEEWVQTATRLASECNRGLKLIGTLKKEIGVDSQLMLADRKMDMVMGILVHTLSEQPHLLDQIELQMSALKDPTHIQEIDYEVID